MGHGCKPLSRIEVAIAFNLILFPRLTRSPRRFQLCVRTRSVFFEDASETLIPHNRAHGLTHD